jgi:hypothetical protein
MNANRAGMFATALLSGAVAVGIGIGAGPVHAAPLPEDQIKQNCEAKGGAYWTQVAADGTQNSTCSTNDGQGLSCVTNYRNGESWGGSCNRAAPPPKPTGT